MILSVIIFESVLVFLMLVFLFTKKTKFNYIMIAFFLSVLWNTSFMLPKEYLYFQITDFSFFVIISVFLLILFFQKKVKHYFLPVMFLSSVIAITISNGNNSIIPLYIMYEIVLLIGTGLLLVTGKNKFPVNFLNIHFLLAGLSGISVLFFIFQESFYFKYLFFILLILRAGLLPLWLVEKKLFYDNPFTYAAYYILKQIPVIIIITKLDIFFPAVSDVSNMMSIISYLSVISLIMGGILINNLKSSNRLFSSPVIISFSLVYLSISMGLDSVNIMLGIGSALFVIMLSSLVFNYYKNKSQIVSFNLLEIDIYDYKHLLLLSVLFIFLLPLPYFPFVLLEFHLLHKALINQHYIMTLLLIIGFFSYKITAIKVISRILSRRLYGKKVSD